MILGRRMRSLRAARDRGQMRFLQMPAANCTGALIAYRSSLLVLMAPTIAVSTAPATPPPATWPMMLPISGVEALLASSGIKAQKLPAGTAADGARDGISKHAEIDVLGRAPCDIAADGAADDLDDQVDEHSRHNTSLPRSGVRFFGKGGRRTIAALSQPKRL